VGDPLYTLPYQAFTDPHPLSDVKIILTIEYIWKIGDELRGTNSLAVNQWNNVQVQQVVGVSTLAKRAHMKKQINHLTGGFANRVIQPLPSIMFPVPVYNGTRWQDVCSQLKGNVSIIEELDKGREVSLERFSDDFQSFTWS
tara:strand:+ start:756 stop:1181 length:426 start_codon:yes stop_codon:yes gene_type:complete